MSNVLFLRRGFGLTQDYLAKKLGISRPTFSKKEKNELEWTKREMEILTKVFREFNKKYTIEKIFFDNNFANSEINEK